MDNKQDLENFKSAVLSTAKAIARKSIDPKELEKIAKINVPKILSIENKDEILEARALADSEALRMRYNDENISKQMSREERLAKVYSRLQKKLDMKKLDPMNIKEFKII